MRIIRRIAQWFTNHRRKIAEVGIGFTLFEAFNWVFNNPVYFAVIAIYGFVSGCLMMSAISLVLNIGVLYLYDTMKVDWIGADYLDQVQKKKEKSRTERAIVWAIKEESTGLKQRLVRFGIFLIFSLFVDPVIVSVHYRRRQFAGVTLRDIGILVISTLIANIYWTARIGVLVVVAKAIWSSL